MAEAQARSMLEQLEQSWGECLVPEVPVSPALKSELRTLFGMVPAYARWMANAPWVARAATILLARRPEHVPLRLKSFCSFLISQETACRYCFGATRSLLRVLGTPEAEVDRLERDYLTADLSEPDRLALEFALKVARNNPRPSRADFEALTRAGFDRPTIAEFCFVVASMIFLTRSATMLALPPDRAFEQLGQSALLPLLRPLVLWKMQRTRWTVTPPEQTPLARELLARMQPENAVAALGRVLDQAFGSELLPARTKLLMVGVVARALECAYGQAEVIGRLAPELDPAQVEQILVHLDSPALSPLERRLVPFARETVRYQAPIIQRRMREVTQGLSAPQICELVGVLALANAMCRLTVLLEW